MLEDLITIMIGAAIVAVLIARFGIKRDKYEYPTFFYERVFHRLVILFLFFMVFGVGIYFLLQL